MAKRENQTSNEQLLQLAVRAAEEGNKDGARVMFRQVYDQDKRNERAMLWLARLAKSPRERQQWLRRVLQVNPANETAKSSLKKIQYRSEASDNRTLLIGVAILVMLIVVGGAILVIVSSLP